MKHVLVTTDFSELADEAIAPAADLAQRLGAKLTLAHILTSEKPPEPDPKAPYYKVAKRMWEADHELENQIQANLKERGDAVEGGCETVVARGGAVQGLITLAKDLGVGLIVISSQGRTGLSRILLGSVAEELTRKSPIPVLVWKQPKDS